MADLFDVYLGNGPAAVRDAKRNKAYRVKARRTVANNAQAADDLRMLLDMLALWPHQDPLEGSRRC